MCTQKMRALSYIGTEKITFLPKPDRHTYRRTDISVYRVASLLKTRIEMQHKITLNIQSYVLLIIYEEKLHYWRQLCPN